MVVVDYSDNGHTVVVGGGAVPKGSGGDAFLPVEAHFGNVTLPTHAVALVYGMLCEL